MDAYKTDDKNVATHFGLPPLTGKWLVEDTHIRAEAREAVFSVLCGYRAKNKQFAITETIMYLPADALTLTCT